MIQVFSSSECSNRQRRTKKITSDTSLLGYHNQILQSEGLKLQQINFSIGLPSGSICIQTVSSFKVIGHIGLGPTPMT